MLERISDCFSYCFKRIVWNVFSQTAFNYGTGIHALLDEGKSFKKHLWNRANDFFRIQIAKLTCFCFDFIDAWIYRKDNFEAGKVLLRKCSGGEEPRYRWTKTIIDSG